MMTPNYLPRHECSGVSSSPRNATLSHAHAMTPHPRYVAFLQSSSGLNKPEPCTDRFLDFFVLMLQERKCIRDVIPLSFRFAARKPGCKLVGKLFGMFVLDDLLATP